jgi:hypothetical protein
MKRRNAQFLTTGRHVLSGEHGGVGGGFVAIGLDFHPARDADEGFSAGEVGNVDEGVVEGGEEVGYGEDFFAFDGLWSEFGCFTVYLFRVEFRGDSNNGLENRKYISDGHNSMDESHSSNIINRVPKQNIYCSSIHQT